jgi:hypothetical protein
LKFSHRVKRKKKEEAYPLQWLKQLSK